LSVLIRARLRPSASRHASKIAANESRPRAFTLSVEVVGVEYGYFVDESVIPARSVEEFARDDARLTVIDPPYNRDVELGQLKMIRHSILGVRPPPQKVLTSNSDRLPRPDVFDP
jgi:hypothetical protein